MVYGSPRYGGQHEPFPGEIGARATGDPSLLLKMFTAQPLEFWSRPQVSKIKSLTLKDDGNFDMTVDPITFVDIARKASLS